MAAAHSALLPTTDDEAALKIGDEFVNLTTFNDAAQRLLASQQKQISPLHLGPEFCAR
eukprot:m.385755 g.385755  ORF g.385755 m.385755 type:complete len:58 (+) comp16742_c1_seq15:78-251(+)